MNNKGKFIFSVVFLVGFFSIFLNTKAFSADPDKDRRILGRVIELLSQEHYNPLPVDDKLSEKIFYAFLNALDPMKTIFSKEDIQKLQPYIYTIDDEINGSPIQFIYETSKIYNEKMATNNQFVENYFSQPIDFNVVEFYNTQYEKLDFSTNEPDRLERLRLSIKYQIISKFNQELEDYEKSKTTKEFVNKTEPEIQSKARESVLKNYRRGYNRLVTQFNDDKKFDLFVNTICDFYDPHSSYFAPVEKRSFQESLSGKFYGIGALLGFDDEGMKISSVQPGGPAWKSGQLMANDIILKVAQGNGEWTELSGFEVTDAVKLIRGDKGTEVRLYIKKQNGTFITLSLIREEIVQDEVYARSVVIDKGNHKIGYIRLGEFYFNYDNPNGEHNCSDDIAAEIKKMKNAKIDKIIIDLRYNGGGSLNEVRKMVGQFIDKGPVVQVRDRLGRVTTLEDTEAGTLFDGKLAVMVNEYSASASEIFAAAIQDYKRGIIVGSSSTYGKGTVQRPYPIGRMNYATGESDLGSLKMTFQKFYRINGYSTQRSGVISDIIMPDEAEIYHNQEKDEKNALAWDEIKGLSYQEFKGKAQVEHNIVDGKKVILKDTNFSLLEANLKYLEKKTDSTIPLELTAFKKWTFENNATINQDNALVKLKTPLKVSVLNEDKDRFYNNPDKPKQDRYQAWLKGIETDKYIDVTCDILNKN
ncbi:MAG: carboxy terminal-processing peptidase [Sediminibacterium sp.]|nr:carboxy terminal-processing peptidase [Sediminibacterium sp.]